MRIKRTFAATMREALALVKQEQGPDAVILGNKKVPGGVELISAIDYDETAVAQYASAPADVTRSPQPDQTSDVAADAWVGSVISDTLNDRKEPVLGPVAGLPKKRDVEPAKPPAWLERELERSETRLTPKAPIKPQETKTRPRKQAPAASLKKPKAIPQPKTRVRPVAEKSARPMIDEVKNELKNLRDLMESQLSVLQWDRFSQSHPVRTVLLNLMSEMGLGTDICELVI